MDTLCICRKVNHLTTSSFGVLRPQSYDIHLCPSQFVLGNNELDNKLRAQDDIYGEQEPKRTYFQHPIGYHLVILKERNETIFYSIMSPFYLENICSRP